MRLWLARDLDGMLFLYTKKPKYHSRCEMFFAIDGDWINLSECNMDDFPEAVSSKKRICECVVETPKRK